MRLRHLPGNHSRQALVAIVDQSAFLEPPATEIPSTPAPPVTEQRRIMGLVVGYVRRAIPQLPNFLATRTTNRFEDTPHKARTVRGSSPTSSALPRLTLPQSSIVTAGRCLRTAVPTRRPIVQSGAESHGAFGQSSQRFSLTPRRANLSGSLGTGTERPSSVFTFYVPHEKSHLR